MVDPLLLKLAENGVAFIMGALLVAGLALLVKYVYQHLNKEVDYWRTKAENCINGKLGELGDVEKENEKLKQKVNTLESLINRKNAE